MLSLFWVYFGPLALEKQITGRAVIARNKYWTVAEVSLGGARAAALARTVRKDLTTMSGRRTVPNIYLFQFEVWIPFDDEFKAACLPRPLHNDSPNWNSICNQTMQVIQ